MRLLIVWPTFVFYNKQEDDTSSSDVRVFYEEQEMTEFEPPGTWVQALLDTETTGLLWSW